MISEYGSKTKGKPNGYADQRRDQRNKKLSQ